MWRHSWTTDKTGEVKCYVKLKIVLACIIQEQHTHPKPRTFPEVTVGWVVYSSCEKVNSSEGETISADVNQIWEKTYRNNELFLNCMNISSKLFPSLSLCIPFEWIVLMGATNVASGKCLHVCVSQQHSITWLCVQRQINGCIFRFV